MLRAFTDGIAAIPSQKSAQAKAQDTVMSAPKRLALAGKRPPSFVVGITLLALIAQAAALITQTTAANALAAWLSESELRTALAGKTLDGQYANGRAFTESYGEDGRLWYLEAGNKIYGHWSITAGSFCTIYDTDSSGGCFRVAKVSKNCFEFYFVSRTEDAAPGRDGDKPKWTARASVSGEDEACKDEVAV